jgi:hypothetical protein
MIWDDICWKSGRSMISLQGRINSRDYLGIWRTKFIQWLKHWFPEKNAIFQDDNAPIHTA